MEGDCKLKASQSRDATEQSRTLQQRHGALSPQPGGLRSEVAARTATRPVGTGPLPGRPTEEAADECVEDHVGLSPGGACVVVGVPRSGTTLVNHILSAHPQAAAAGTHGASGGA